MNKVVYDIVIIGSGPAGLTAAIYGARAGFKALVIAGEQWGGGLMQTTEVDNFPGFPEGIHGSELMMQMRKQVEKFKVEIIDVNFQKADFRQKPFTITAGDKDYQGKAIIIATGATHSPLDVPGEEKFVGRGVSYCATCDAPFFRGKTVAVVGGGNTALTEAIFIAKFAKNVIVIHRRDSLRADQVLQQKAKETENISLVLETEVLQITGDVKVNGLKLKSKIKNQKSKIHIKSKKEEKDIAPEELGGKMTDVKDSEIIWELPIDGVFAAVGYRPVSELFEGIEKDEKGYIKTNNNSMTNINGIFVAGDVSDNLHKQAVIAAGMGATAALDAEKWLSSSEK